MADIDIHDSAEQAEQATQAAHPGCTCGEVDEDLPQIDVQTIPHAIRHAAIFGAVEALKPGGGIIISANHNPLPLLAQLEARYGQTYTTTYVEKGPDWRVLIRHAG